MGAQLEDFPTSSVVDPNLNWKQSKWEDINLGKIKPKNTMLALVIPWFLANVTAIFWRLCVPTNPSLPKYPRSLQWQWGDSKSAP
jgi:hypothetical protein